MWTLFCHSWHPENHIYILPFRLYDKEPHWHCSVEYVLVFSKFISNTCSSPGFTLCSILFQNPTDCKRRNERGHAVTSWWVLFFLQSDDLHCIFIHLLSGPNKWYFSRIYCKCLIVQWMKTHRSRPQCTIPVNYKSFLKNS